MSRAFTDNINSFNVSNVSNTFTFNATDDESRILAWLSPLEPQVRHQDIRNERVDSVGNWLLETEEFKSWYNGSWEDQSDHAALFCHGNPGVGKSYICSIVVDYLCDRAIERDMAVACFYYDFASREEHSPTNMLGSLLKQILRGLKAIPLEIKLKFRGQNKVIGGRGLQLSDIVNMFPDVSSSQRTFICVDALDECVLKHQREVFDALGEILKRSPNIRMFMTGRSHIRGVVERELGGGVASVSIKIRDEDKVTYLRERLKKDTTPEVMDSGLKDDIMESIPGDITETFLLAALKVEAILRETTISRRRKRLSVAGDGLGLGDAYETTLERIRAQDQEKAKLAMTALMWICHSERPLQVDELRHALAVEIGFSEFDRDNVPATETLLACCQGLVTVDKEASAVRLIHYTLREHLSAHPKIAARAHSTMAETCLTYLNSDQAKALSDKPQFDLSPMPFLNYCSRYWGIHANRELSDHAQLLAMKLLDQHEKHIAAKLLFEQIVGPDDSVDVDASSMFSGLHCASFFGIVGVMATLLGMGGCDINQRDSAGITALTWAVRGGRDEAVKLLLEQKAVDPEKLDNSGYTPFLWAVIEGHESVIKQLLDREDVNPDRPDNEGKTPLSWAAIIGLESVVKLLLGRGDVNPDQPDNEGNTPLSWAAIKGHESVVKQLLDREDVNPDMPDNEGVTPVSWAVIGGHESVVKLLLDRVSSPDKPDNKGITPLSRAAIKGHEPMVKLLLDREDVNPDRPDNEGNTTLSWAAIGGHESVAKLLLGREDVNPNTPNCGGNTILSRAAMKGHESVVKLLLGRGDVNPDEPNNEGNTPLSWAAIGGHESVVKQLLDRIDVNPNKPNRKGNTTLSRAAMKGCESVVKLLLDRGDVDPDEPDKEGNTPLSWAAIGGHKPVVKLLLDRGDVNPDRPDNEGNTPLSWAAIRGHESVVKLLLGRGDVNPDKPDNEGHTPLSWAAMEGYEPVVALLLDREDVKPDRPDNGDRTPLSWAAGRGYEQIVDLLLEQQDVNPDRPDKSGHMPLYYASQNGHERVVKLLQARKPPTPLGSDSAELQGSLSSLSL